MPTRFVMRAWVVLLAVGSGITGMVMLHDARAASVAAKELDRLGEQVLVYEQQVRESGQLKLRSMRRHHKAVEQTRTALFDDLLKLQVAGTKPISPLACKLRIIEANQKMQIQLNDRDVEIGDGVADFGFGEITRSGKMPVLAEVPTILQRLELTEEIVDLTARTGVGSIDRFEFLGSDDRDRHTVIRFSLSCSGDFAAVRGLVARLNHARYFLVVRSVSLGGLGDDKISANVEVDYLLFHELNEVRADAS